MNREIDFGSLGIPTDQTQILKSHFEKAKMYVFPQDPGIEESLVWLKNNLHLHFEKESANLLYQIASRNIPDTNVEYQEEGYDSCQSHRKLSKVLGEAILLGGIVYEFNLLGIKIGVDEAGSIIRSKLVLSESQANQLSKIAKKCGANQDFLFPGVTPSGKETLSLEEYAYLALSGKPKTSVRSLLGVGGIRFDKDWNYATDFSTFVDLKIKEDKRYYPGIGVYFALLNFDNSKISLLSNGVFSSLAQSIKSVQKKEYQGVSVLCSACIPSWGEMKKYQYNSGYHTVELAESFHSPAYDFAGLLRVVEKIEENGNLDPNSIALIKKLEAKLGNIWSFNSTIHLPWTSEFAGLSNDLIGSITNGVGDYAIRYGVGWSGMSLEAKEYHFGQARKFPSDLAGKVAYGTFFYPESDLFQGKVEVSDLVPSDIFWSEVKKSGFMATALVKLEKMKNK